MESDCYNAARAVAQIDTAAIARNYRHIAAHCGGRTLAVVKANAYGHGISLVLPALCAAGCDFFAVATLQEALEVRALAPSADILILGYTSPAAAPLLIRHNITQAVFSAPYATALSCAAEGVGRVRAHLKINGGMQRLGFAPNEAPALASTLQAPNLHVWGAFVHLPCADTNLAQTKRILGEFRALCHALPRKLFLHAAASAAALSLPQSHLNGVRVGLALYGYAPVPTSLPLCPAMRLAAPILQLHRLPSGTPVGYGGSFITARPTLLGVLPCGYADGLSRDLSGMQVTLLHGGQRFAGRLAGRICMDFCTVDLTDTPALVGDRVVLWENAAVAAAYRGTIPYEILTAVSARVPRQKGENADGLL